MLPLNQLTETGNRIRSPLERFSYEDPAIEWQRADPDSVAAERLGSGILHRPGQWCCSYLRYPVSVREFAAIVNRLHQVVGDRRTYVANFIDDLYPGGAYFLADLKPAPILFEPITMAINQSRLDEFLAYFEDHISEVQAIVAVYPDLREVEMFKSGLSGLPRDAHPVHLGIDNGPHPLAAYSGRVETILPGGRRGARDSPARKACRR